MISKIICLVLLLFRANRISSAATTDLDVVGENQPECYCQDIEGCYRDNDLLIPVAKCCEDICEDMEVLGTTPECNTHCPCYHETKKYKKELKKRDEFPLKLTECQRNATASNLRLESRVDQLQKEIKNAKASLYVIKNIWFPLGILITVLLTALVVSCLFHLKSGTFLRKVPKDDCPIGSASDVRIQLVKNNWDSKLNNLSSVNPAGLQFYNRSANNNNLEDETSLSEMSRSVSSNLIMNMAIPNSLIQGSSSSLPSSRSQSRHCIHMPTNGSTIVPPTMPVNTNTHVNTNNPAHFLQSPANNNHHPLAPPAPQHCILMPTNVSTIVPPTMPLNTNTHVNTNKPAHFLHSPANNNHHPLAPPSSQFLHGVTHQFKMHQQGLTSMSDNNSSANIASREGSSVYASGRRSQDEGSAGGRSRASASYAAASPARRCSSTTRMAALRRVMMEQEREAVIPAAAAAAASNADLTPGSASRPELRASVSRRLRHEMEELNSLPLLRPKTEIKTITSGKNAGGGGGGGGGEKKDDKFFELSELKVVAAPQPTMEESTTTTTRPEEVAFWNKTLSSGSKEADKKQKKLGGLSRHQADLTTTSTNDKLAQSADAKTTEATMTTTTMEDVDRENEIIERKSPEKTTTKTKL